MKLNQTIKICKKINLKTNQIKCKKYYNNNFLNNIKNKLLTMIIKHLNLIKTNNKNIFNYNKINKASNNNTNNSNNKKINNNNINKINNYYITNSNNNKINNYYIINNNNNMTNSNYINSKIFNRIFNKKIQIVI